MVVIRSENMKYLSNTMYEIENAYNVTQSKIGIRRKPRPVDREAASERAYFANQQREY